MAKSTVSNIRKKKRIGRPPVGAIPVLVRIPPAEMLPIDNWVSNQDKFLTRPEAIRRLVELGLRAKTKWALQDRRGGRGPPTS
jgi:hypothetical protein